MKQVSHDTLLDSRGCLLPTRFIVQKGVWWTHDTRVLARRHFIRGAHCGGKQPPLMVVSTPSDCHAKPDQENDNQRVVVPTMSPWRQQLVTSWAALVTP